MKFYVVLNDAKPHCMKCSVNYDPKDHPTKCTAMYGKGKERMQCGGTVTDKVYLPWSLNLLRDYSLVENGDLDLFNEINDAIQDKINMAQEGKAAGVQRGKVNVQIEIENAMRRRNINVVTFFTGSGELESQSVYVIDYGENRMSEFGKEELEPSLGKARRFEDNASDLRSDVEGFLTFIDEGNYKPEDTKEEVDIDELAKDWPKLRAFAKEQGLKSVTKNEIVAEYKASLK